MRPPGGIIAPEESLIAAVFKFVEQPESNNEKQAAGELQKCRDEFKIMSLKVKGGMECVPELKEEGKVLGQTAKSEQQTDSS
ncbi:unnamed protein product [Linum trigynum]|uniref:Uncharacterized protein n=1 Tax=Linum trigynum TaxID=586398 RepID=A0AAV2EHK3_9ROSI